MNSCIFTLKNFMMIIFWWYRYGFQWYNWCQTLAYLGFYNSAKIPVLFCISHSPPADLTNHQQPSTRHFLHDKYNIHRTAVTSLRGGQFGIEPVFAISRSISKMSQLYPKLCNRLLSIISRICSSLVSTIIVPTSFLTNSHFADYFKARKYVQYYVVNTNIII